MYMGQSTFTASQAPGYLSSAAHLNLDSDDFSRPYQSPVPVPQSPIYLAAPPQAPVPQSPIYLAAPPQAPLHQPPQNSAPQPPNCLAASPQQFSQSLHELWEEARSSSGLGVSLENKKFEWSVLFPEAHPPGTGDTYFQSLGSGGPFACAPGTSRYEGEGCQIGLENGPPQINFETRKVEGVPMDTQFDKGEIFEAFLNSLDD